MECTARILRERKTFPGSDKKPVIAVQIYCPIMGEVSLVGERAEEAIRKTRQKDGKRGFLSIS